MAVGSFSSCNIVLSVFVYLQTEEQLTLCVQQWIDYEEISERVGGWLKDVDTEIRGTELQATLQEKRQKLQHVKVGILVYRTNVLSLQYWAPQCTCVLITFDNHLCDWTSRKLQLCTCQKH